MVADGPLAALPLGLLPHRGQALIEHLEVIVTSRPSLTGRSPAPTRATRVLGVAAPSTAVTSDVLTLKHSTGELLELRHVALGSPRTLVHEQASVRAVLGALPGATVAHFACHGQTDPASSEHTGLMLADALLSLAAMARLDLRRLTLVVLSACSTGVGAVQPDGSYSSGAATLVEAGAQNVLCALGDIGDEDALNFMKELYPLLARRDAASALRAVQAEHIKRGLPMATWAAYQLRARSVPSRASIYWIIRGVEWLQRMCSPQVAPSPWPSEGVSNRSS